MSDLTSRPTYGEGAITPLSSGRAFWATGTKNTRRTALGATAIVVLLAMITWLIWMSPTDNAVRKIVGDVVKPISTNMSLKNDRANLLTQVVSQKSQMNDQSSELAALTAQLATANGRASALQGQLSTARADAAQASGKATSLADQVAGRKAEQVSGVPDSGAATLGGGSTNGDPTTPGAAPNTGSEAGGGDGAATPPGPVTPSTTALADIKNPTSRYFGLYTAQSPFSWSEFDDVTGKIGTQPNSAGYFQGWDQDFRADAVQRSWAKGDLPIITWESQSSTAGNNEAEQSDYSLPKIIRGDFDAYVKKYADAIVANDQPVGLRLDQEMNATWYPWSEDDGHGKSVNGNGPGDYVTMWRHVHDIFEAEGANNYVNWIWAPNRIDNLTKTHKLDSYNQSLYPGADYVDWIGMSGYERPSGDGPQDGTFDDTFGNTLDMLRHLDTGGKPIFLAEIGATEGGGLKAGWINDLFTALALPENKDIIGFSWFSLTVTTTLNGQLTTNDWRLNSTASALAAFSAGISRSDIDYTLRAATQ